MSGLIPRVRDRVSGSSTAILDPVTTLMILFGGAHGAAAQQD
jgi:hypothetical protein